MTSFGNAAVDIDIVSSHSFVVTSFILMLPVHTSDSFDSIQLEQEIAAKEHASRHPPAELSGNIAGMGGPSRPRPMQEVGLNDDLDTLDEPVWDTVKRDLRTVGLKFGHVIFPTPDRQQLLRDWDLWGPLFICVGLSLLLQHNHPDGSAPQFTQVFAITFFGSIVVTLNIKLLGGQISFFQSLCVIGYCLLPPLVAALICSVVLHGKLFLLRLAISAVGFCWSTFVISVTSAFAVLRLVPLSLLMISLRQWVYADVFVTLISFTEFYGREAQSQLIALTSRPAAEESSLRAINLDANYRGNCKIEGILGFFSFSSLLIEVPEYWYTKLLLA
ncbi:Yip1 domain protein [Ancylostoma ceylanicum]|uniref:Protein YIPF n=1 Tax=Ancylostoma ceylanicum TaxID=53326 RepID=A0A0D6LN81_9BILA|nr:Yip1 domain protein [Ancylostoma ceylanicum]